MRRKLFLLYFLTIFIPLIVTAQIILTISGNKIIEQTTNLVQEGSEQTSRNIQVLMNRYVDMVNRLSFDQELSNYLNPGRVYSSDLESIDAYAYYLNPVTSYDFNSKNSAAKLKIYFRNETLLQDLNIFIYADKDVQQQAEYQSALAAQGKLVWGKVDRQIYLARAMYNTQREFVAVVAVLISRDVLDSLMEEGDTSGKTLVVVDRQGDLISSGSNFTLTSPIQERLAESDGEVAPFNVVDERTGNTSKVLIGKLGDAETFNDWRLLTIIPLDQVIHDEVVIRQTLFIVFSLCMLISCGIFIMALSRITARVKALVAKMQSSGSSGFSVIEDTGAADEIGVLTRSFNTMVENLQKSIIENYEVNLKLKDIEIKKREAELYALQNQINPHFLFNTLESIRMGLHNKGDAETSKVVMSFSRLFRHLLNWEGELISLEEELGLVEKYLSIQKYRFQDKIGYRIEFPENKGKALVPKLMIQPLVENAVKHGIENMYENGFISIKVTDDIEDTMRIIVEDDGAGISADKLDAIRAELISTDLKKSGSIGLKNVNDRIILHFGSGYGVMIANRIPRGTRVGIRIPVRFDNG